MELEFDRDVLLYYDTVAEVTLCQEETLESIVPDACPDILRIVDVCGQTTLSNKQARQDVAVVGGSVRAVILYQPEDGAGLRRMEITLPFTCQAEAKGLTERGTVLASPRLRYAEARALNPRKVLIRVDLAIDITACRPVEHMMCQSVLDAETHNICEKQETLETYILSSVLEKPFTFTEQVRFTGNTPGGMQVLAVRAHPVCGESRIIGNKLIFKGAAEVCALCQEPGGTLTVVRENLPFSQIIEIPTGTEEGDCRITVELTGLDWATSPDEGRGIEVTLELLAQAQIFGRRSLSLLQDLYSTSHTTEVSMEAQELCRLEEFSVRPQAVRELLETDDLIRSVVDSRITLGEVTQIREDDQAVLTAETWVAVLYQDESGQLRTLRRVIPVVCRVGCLPGFRCSCICRHSGELYAVPSAGGAEVRFALEFQCMITERTQTPCVCEARIGDLRTAGEGVRPSVILRLASPGEGVWELAKAYGTTGEQILQANELTNGDCLDGRMLLIPSLR